MDFKQFQSLNFVMWGQNGVHKIYLDNVIFLKAGREDISKRLYELKISSKKFHVSPKGDDSNDGLSSEKAFKTLQRAADMTLPGDTVYVMNGVYENKEPGYGTLLRITKSGQENAWIRYKAYPGHKPKIVFDCYKAIEIKGASYIEVSGFEIEGRKGDKIDYDYAFAHQNDNLAELDNDGISVGPMGDHSNPQSPFPTHIIIRSNHVHHCSGMGIGTHASDYVWIEDNIVHSCAWYAPWAKSGIGVGWGYNSDDNKGYKHILRRNICFNNNNLIKWRSVGRITDGNGIIIDTMDCRDRKDFPPYEGRTLAISNISFNNGGSGIHTLNSYHVDIVGNIAYKNYKKTVVKGEVIRDSDSPDIYGADCKDVNIVNNIIYLDKNPGVLKNNISWNNINKDLYYDYNVYYNVDDVELKGLNDIIADPMFVNATTNFKKADFKLNQASPALKLKKKFPGFEEWNKNVRPELKKKFDEAFGIKEPKADKVRYKKTIKVDGKITDWKEIKSMPLPYMKKKKSSVKIAWSEKGLYGYVKAGDKTIKENKKSPWEADCFELFIEKDYARAESAYETKNAIQIFMCPDTESGPGKAYLMANYHDKDKQDVKMVNAVWRTVKEGYIIEFFIPAKVLNPAEMKSGTKMSFNFALSDNGKPVLQYYRDKDENNGWRSPVLWGAVQLSK